MTQWRVLLGRLTDTLFIPAGHGASHQVRLIHDAVFFHFILPQEYIQFEVNIMSKSRRAVLEQHGSIVALERLTMNPILGFSFCVQSSLVFHNHVDDQNENSRDAGFYFRD